MCYEVAFFLNRHLCGFYRLKGLYRVQVYSGSNLNRVYCTLILFFQACLAINNKNATSVFDGTHKVPYCYYGNQWVSYENVDSIVLKVNFITLHFKSFKKVWLYIVFLLQVDYYISPSPRLNYNYLCNQCLSPPTLWVWTWNIVESGIKHHSPNPFKIVKFSNFKAQAFLHSYIVKIKKFSCRE